MAPRKINGTTKARRTKGGGGDANAPTDLEWTRMKKYGSFTVSDEDDKMYRFMRGQMATVLPDRFPPGTDVSAHEYWVVKIKDIRAFEYEDDTNEVWVKVQWYYSAKDVASVVKSFSTESCGKYERVFSDHFDYVTPEAFNESITVSHLRDDDPEQPSIDRQTFYMRYEIERQVRRLKPKPGVDSCTCNKPYSPDNETATSLMHFCPRPKCRKWYHQSCLLKQGSKESCAARARSRRLIAASPDDDDIQPLFRRIPEPPSKRTRNSIGGKSQKARSDEVDPALDRCLGQLPDMLVLVAEQPIVRGGLYERGGVSGNVKAVVQARRLVYEALDGQSLSDDWEDTVLGQITSTTLDDAVVRVKGKKAMPQLLCPQCSSAI